MRTTGLIRLTHDPELRTAQVAGEDRAVCTMRAAIRMPRGRDAGFVDIVAWGRLGELCAQYLTSGSAAYVDGHLRQDEWTDGEGERQQRHRVVADDVQFVGGDRRPAEPEIEF